MVRLHRLMAILLLLESRGQIKAKELAVALETSVRTIYRDIDTLCEAGIPLAATTGPNGGIHFMEGYSVNMHNLHGDDVINLYLSGIGIHPDGQSDTGIRLKHTLLKLEQSLPLEYHEDILKAKERFYFDETPWWGQLPKVECLETLRKSVLQSKKLMITYRKVYGETSSRIVRPYGLVVKTMEWYLVAYCEKSGVVRTFKCERIKEAEMMDEPFDFPTEFSLERYWKESAQHFFDTRREVEQYPVLIKLPRYKADSLKHLSIYDIHEEQGYLWATVNMHSWELARDEVLDVIGYAEVITPVELREYAKNELIQRMKAYDS